MPVSGQLSRTTGGGPAITSWFPVAFRPPAFASWSSCARQGAGPSLRSAYRSLLPGPDPDEVATFRAHELRPGWVPSLPRGLRCPHGRQVIPGRRMPPCSGPSLYPRPATHHRRLLITRHHQGFTVVHPSGLPLACSLRVEREPSGFFPGLHTPPLPAAHAGVGTGILGTCLSYVTISWSSSQRSHSPRATSCRTDLIRACAPSGAAHPCLVRKPAITRPEHHPATPEWRPPKCRPIPLTNIRASIRFPIGTIENTLRRPSARSWYRE